MRLLRFVCLALALIAPPPLLAAADASIPAPLPALREVQIDSTMDGTAQPSLVWAPETAKEAPTPLLVYLHSWSGDFRQDNSAWQRQAVERGWIYLHPNFRGRNDNPQAGGSPAARRDVLDAIDWAASEFRVDPQRIYLAGTSGGGHMAMLLAGHHPRRFSAVSAWVGISDLAEWHRFHVLNGKPDNYAQMVAACCGGEPGASEEIDRQYRDRSPVFHLHRAKDVPLDLNAGADDGHTGSVPVWHTLRAFNVVAEAVGGEPVSEAEMHQLASARRLSHPGPTDQGTDPEYGRELRLRRAAGRCRVTIFDGGHEGLAAAACAWLAQQSRPVALLRTE
jgi:poly(3-hydroxybutyrate) depolymerase